MSALIDTNIGQDQIVRDTDKAVCIELHSGVTRFGGVRQVWFPKSQIEWIAQGCFHPTMHAPAWLVREKL